MNILNAIPVVSPSTRRSFLQKAASLAAAGAAGGAAGLAALPPPADAAPIGDLENFIAPAFHEIGDQVDDALEAWQAVHDDLVMRRRAMELWERRYPMPPCLLPDDEDYIPTSRSDWLMRKQNVMLRLQLAKRQKDCSDLSNRYLNAVNRFAAMEAKTASELYYKVGFGIAVDSRDGIIARSVLRDLYNFRTRLIPA